MTVGCCSSVTLMRRNHLVATHRSPIVRRCGSAPDRRPTITGVFSGSGDEGLRVVYISGWGRSGTTVVDRLLGQLPEFCSVGELRSLWDCDPVSQPCSCGQVVAECALWAPSLCGALGGVTSSEFATMRELRDRSSRSRDVPVRWASSTVHRPAGPITLEYGDRLEALYRQVAARSGAHTIVDSSKHPSEAQLLTRRAGIDLHLLHMVRDPRGVAYSWTCSRQRHGGGADAPPERGALSSTAWWTAWNSPSSGRWHLSWQGGTAVCATRM